MRGAFVINGTPYHPNQCINFHPNGSTTIVKFWNPDRTEVIYELPLDFDEFIASLGQCWKGVNFQYTALIVKQSA